MNEQNPRWLDALLKKHQTLLNQQWRANITDTVFARLAQQPKVALPPETKPEPSANGAEMTVSWNSAISRAYGKLSATEQTNIERAVLMLSRQPENGKYALDHCDAFREITVGRYKVFYLTRGRRIDIRGLQRIGSK